MTHDVEPAVRRCLIVDDEPPARRKLRRFLTGYADIDVVGEAGDGAEAVELIRHLEPDLVLLDVQMPELDGFAVLSALHDQPLPYVIFVTAYEEYAVRAFEVGAVDYLLKPVDPDRFRIALDRALTQLAAPAAEGFAGRLERVLELLADSKEFVDRFLVKRGSRSVFVPATDVEWIEAAGNYLRLHTSSGVHVVRGTMRDAERRLDKRRFVRIHRSRAVNLDRVSYLEPWSHGDQLVVLRSGEKLVMSRRFRDRLPPMFRG